MTGRKLRLRIARLIMQKRYGRAARTFARAHHTSGRMLPTVAEREAWALKQ
jgi:hypothetical protein